MLIQPTAACHTKPDCVTRLQRPAQDQHLLYNVWDKVGIPDQKLDPSNSTFLDGIHHSWPKSLGPYFKGFSKKKGQTKQQKTQKNKTAFL